ncbi:MAG: N-acetyltransferase [Chitinophagaceae bacterium]|nr:MAG: N-acetyltransferase [Chitinophagaceae bacterium]
MIKLEYFTPNDFTQLINWIDSEELLVNWAGSLFSYPLTWQSMDWYISNTNDLASSDAFVYKVVEVESGEIIGHISLGGISRKNRSARISRVLLGSTQHKGKGYCKEMIRAVLKIGFEELNLHRISLGVYDFNTAALNCYKSAGFSVDGVSRDVLLHKGEWWSLVEMSVLEHEWEKIKA